MKGASRNCQANAKKVFHRRRARECHERFEELKAFCGGFTRNMIFGYISKREYPRLEDYLEECDPKGMAFRYRCGAKKAFFFRGGVVKENARAFYHESHCLMLCEGIPIRGSPDNKYELVDVISDEDIKKGFNNFVDEIVSNVSAVFFKKGNDPKLYLSSNRAATNRIYYQYTNEGIAFSSSFSVLLHFAPFRLNYEAIYSILKYGYAPPPLTLSKDVYVVQPSHYVKVDLSENEIYHDTFFRFCFSEDHGFHLNRLDHILDATSEILSQMDSCLLLSGGVDSTLLAHKMSGRSNRNIRSYFLAFGKNDHELPFAEEASKSSNSQLDVTYMDESKLFEIIDEIATFYDYPFKDGSVIPTYYLVKHISEEGEKIVVDGTGGDVCLGSETIALDKFWMFAYGLPKVVKKLVSSIYSHSGIWKKESFLEKPFRTIAKCCEVDCALGPFVGSPPNDIFFSNFEYDESIGRLSMNLVNKLISPSSRQVFKERTTVADIFFTCGAQAGAKTDLRNRFPQVYTLYPYLWKDILEEQGRISWSAKVNNGIVKWPLKRLLESYMPHYFIYRKKSGLTPDLESYIKNQKVYSLIKETFMNPNIVDRFVNKNKFIKLVENLPTIERFSAPLRNLLWGLLFVELWASKHL
jgi:asparagine synthase (glutamine-hydrolysing)